MNYDELSTIFMLPRIHTAIAEWAFIMLYILLRRKRFSTWATAGISVGFLGLLLMANIIGEHQFGFLWLVFMALCMVLMAALLFTTCKLSLPETLYYWSRAFLAAEFSASLEWQITYYVLHTIQAEEYHLAVLTSYAILAVVYGAVFLVMLLIERKMRVVRNKIRFTWRETISAMAIALAAFSLGNFNFAFRDNAFTSSLGAGVLYVRTLVDLGGIIMLFAHHAQRQEINLAYELEATNNLMHKQYEQYRQYYENDEALQHMYHDLKHQIAFIRGEKDSKKREALLSEMDEVIRRHEAATDTGHTVLDTILTSKNLVCMQKHITMTCFADAKHLDFMDVMDVCAIFGNALDNAIEYEEKVADEGNRLIKVSVYPQDPFLMIRIENYCEDKVLINGDVPRTNKEDKRMHGYGVKSIRRVAQKYGGHVKLSSENDWFSIMILIPLEKKT
jgi:hypothetical protein